ncbi:MAG: hypothetical protein P4L51_07045 [Puia sp.]|nr:hypothetical protein [Puia sp.]
MKITLLSLAAATMIATCSCSSAYKAAQTPDDVYYSPSSKNTRTNSSSADDQPEYYSTNPSDQYVQMKVQDEARWSYFDDYNYYDSYYASPVGGPYWGSAYGYYGIGSFIGLGSGLGFYNPYSYWNGYYAWNCYYNPYFYNPYYGGGMIVTNPKYSPYGTTAYTGLRTFSPGSYRPATSASSGGNRFYSPAASRSGNNNNNTYFRGTNQVNNNTYYRPNNTNNTNYQPSSQPVRTFTPSSSGGGGGGGISRPGRF